MIDPLKTLGIEKGKPFSPDKQTETILAAAAKEAQAWLEAQYEGAFTPFFATSRWAVPVAPEVIEALQANYGQPDSYPVDGRGLTYSFVFFSAKHLGAGQFYLMTVKDKDGNDFDGGAGYRLTVPPDAPVRQYWSATLYDRATHGLIRDKDRASRSSQTPELVKNADGSVDLFFAPEPPAGKEANWVPTEPGSKFEVLFRLYGPTKTFFDKAWVLPDVVKAE